MSAPINKARSVYEAVLKRHKKEKKVAQKAWSDACVAEIESITTIEQAEAAFKAAPWGTSAKRKVLRVWARLCKTRGDFIRARSAAGRRFEDRTNPVDSRWEAMGRAMLRHADTPEKVVEVARFCYGLGRNYIFHARVNRKAFDKWIAFYPTREKLEDAWKQFGERYDSPFYREWYYRELDLREEKETGKPVRRSGHSFL